MIFFGKKSDYIKFSDVISILEGERVKHHYASRSSLDKKEAIESAIRAVKIHHIKNNPKKYMVWKKMFNNEAQHLLEFEELKGLIMNGKQSVWRKAEPADEPS
jgi:hypothetical protein